MTTPGTTPSKTRVLYVAGMGRSGSTLIAQYFELRSAAVHIGELRYLWDRGIDGDHLCECGKPFGRCDFWAEVLKHAYGSDVLDIAAQVHELAPRVDRLRRIPQAFLGTGREFHADLHAYEQLLAPMYAAVAAVAGSDVVIDSSKDPSYLYVLDGFESLEVLPVHLVRDPRAVAYSWTRKRARPEIHWEVQYMQTLRPQRSARNWLVYNAAIDALTTRAEFGARMSYEGFAADPDGVTAQVLAAVGVPTRPVTPPPGGGHSLSGNPMRFHEGPLVVKLDKEWEVRLSARDKRVVTGITMPLLHRYGYPIHESKAAVAGRSAA